MMAQTTWTAARALAACGLLLAATMATNCSERQESRPIHTQPIEQPPPTRPEPTPSHPPEGAEQRPTASSRPEPAAPETRPETTKRASTYDSRPPYPVDLFVKNPTEKQPGWLRIEGLLDKSEPATAQGRFPEQNRIYVDTNNVSRIRIHVGHLPLRPKERVILQIDGQGMVISGSRRFTTLERLPTGEWVIVKDQND